MAACAWSSEKMNRIFGRSAAGRDRMKRMQTNAAVTDKHSTRWIMDHPKVVKRFQQQQDYSHQVQERFKQTCVRKKSFQNQDSLFKTPATTLHRLQQEMTMHPFIRLSWSRKPDLFPISTNSVSSRASIARNSIGSQHGNLQFLFSVSTSTLGI
jgi:hypothetical protein